jgi:autotransporter translocation and assembly factor TamB
MAKTNPTRMMKRFWHYLRWVVWILAGVCAVVLVAGWVIAAVYLNSEGFRQTVIEKADALLPGSIEIDGHKISLLSGRVSISGIRLKDTRSRLIGAVDRLQVTLFWPALILRDIRIRHVEFSGLDLKLHYDQQDRLNLMQAFAVKPSAPESGSDASPWQVQVDDFRLHNARIDYHRPLTGHRVQAESIDLVGAGDLEQRMVYGKLSVGRIDLAIGDVQQVFEQVVLSVSHRPDQAAPIQLDVRLPDAHLDIHGRMDTTLRMPTVDLAIAFDLNLVSLQPWLPQQMAPAGLASGRGRMRGPIDDPAGEMVLEIRNGQVDRIPVDRLSANLTLEHRRVTLSKLNTQSRWGRIELAGTIDFQSMFADNWRHVTAGPEALAYDVTLAVRDLLPGQLPLEDVAVNGRWQADLAAAGTGVSGASASGSATVEVHAQDYTPPSASTPISGSASARLAWIGPKLTITALSADTGGHSLHAQGDVDLAEQTILGSGELKSSRLSEIGDWAGIVLPSGQGSLSLSWRGRWTHPWVHATLLAKELAMDQWRLGRLFVDAQMDPDGSVRLPRLILENRGSLLEGRASLMLRKPDGEWQSDPPVTLTLAFEQLEPHDFGPLGPWNGRLRGRLDVTGTVLQPVAELDLADGTIGWQAVSGNVRGKARWQNGSLGIQGLVLTVGRSHARFEGALKWRDAVRDRWSANPLVTARILDNAIFLEDFYDGLTGRLTLAAALDGRMNDLRGTFQLKGDDLNLHGQRASNVVLGGRLSDQRLHMDDLLVQMTPGQVLTGAGWYGFDGTYKISVNGEGIDLRHIDLLQRSTAVEGRMAVDIQGQGSLERPAVTVDIGVADPGINGSRWDDFHFKLALTDREVEVDAHLNFSLKARGRLDSGEFSAEAHFDQSDLTPYLAAWAGDKWAGRITGALRATGNWHHLDRLDAAAAITAATLDYQSVPLVAADGVHLKLSNGVIDVPRARFAIMSDGSLTVTASGDLSRNLEITADGRVPLEALAPFTDSLADAQGDLVLRFNADGPVSTWRWHADLTLAEVGFALPEMAQTIQHLNGHVMISPDSAVVESVSGSLDGGRFSLNGRLGLDRFKPVQGELALEARSVPLQWPGIMDVVVNGDLKLTGGAGKAQLTGRIDLVDGTYYKDVRLNLWSAVSQPRRGETVSRTQAPAAWMEAVALSVTLGYRNPILIDNNLARLQVVPDLKISGTLAAPILNGRAEVTEGEIIFRGKSFAVTTGVVDFINPFRIEPTLDVVSQSRIRQWLVTLSLSGTPDRLAFKLSSDPPESDNDILSLILFGRTQTEFAGGDTAGSQTTTQMLAALVATAWGDSLKKSTGVDILELETGNRDNSEDPERIQVTVGKKLGRRLTIKYAVESTNGEMIQRAISEYRFFEKLLASGYQDTKGDYGGELLFRIEFR